MSELGSGIGLPFNDSENYSWGNYSGDYNANTSDTTSSSSAETLTAIATNIVMYALPVAIIGGTVGNVLSVATLCSPYFRHTPCAVLLFALAIVDTLVLAIGGTDYWLEHTFDKLLCELIKRPCFQVQYVVIVLTSVSSWTVVLITFERLVSVMWPFRAKTLCSRKRMLLSWISMFLTCALVWIYPCLYDYRQQLYIAWLSLFIPCFVPFFFIVGGNFVIIYTISAASKERTTSATGSASSAASNARVLTKMLVTVCIVFVMTASPIYVHEFLGVQFGWDEVDGTPHGWYEVLWGLFIVLSFLNHATNFVLYFFSGTQFREAFFKVMCRCRY